MCVACGFVEAANSPGDFTLSQPGTGSEMTQEYAAVRQ